jgi:precorrin-6A/cobalt-precorrin-6A reductase
VFCGVGRLTLPELLAAPQHRYIVRLIDTPNEPLDLRRCKIIQARGPFTTEDDIALFRDHGVEIVLAKNSGGQASISKIEAARALGLPVVMIERPAIPPRACVATVDEALQLLSQLLALDWFAAQLAIERGV